MNLYKYHSQSEQLKHHKHKTNIVPKLAFNKARGMLSRGEKVPQELLNVIGSSPKDALEWADITGERFPEGEKAIGTSSMFDVDMYVHYHLPHGQRFPEAEDKIAKDGSINDIISYAINHIGGRFKKAEEVLLDREDLMMIFMYTKQVIKGRWKKAEELMLRDIETNPTPNYAFHAQYAYQVISDRWPEFERVLKDRINNPRHGEDATNAYKAWVNYKRYFGLEE